MWIHWGTKSQKFKFKHSVMLLWWSWLFTARVSNTRQASNIQVMCIFCYVKYYMKLFQRLFVGAVGLAAQPFYRSTLWRPSRPGKYVLWSHSTRCFLLFSIQRSFIFLENAAKNITESGCCSRQLIKKLLTGGIRADSSDLFGRLCLLNIVRPIKSFLQVIYLIIFLNTWKPSAQWL